MAEMKMFLGVKSDVLYRDEHVLLARVAMGVVGDEERWKTIHILAHGPEATIEIVDAA